MRDEPHGRLCGCALCGCTQMLPHITEVLPGVPLVSRYVLHHLASQAGARFAPASGLPSRQPKPKGGPPMTPSDYDFSRATPL